MWWCKHCGPEHPLHIAWRLVPNPLGTYSIAGAQLKVTAKKVPFAICNNCSRECRGKPT
jgi:hypothetical protein